MHVQVSGTISSQDGLLEAVVWAQEPWILLPYKLQVVLIRPESVVGVREAQRISLLLDCSCAVYCMAARLCPA